MKALFTAADLQAWRLTPNQAPALQTLLEDCGDYYALVEGRPAEPDAAAAEFAAVPAGYDPADVLCLGLRAETAALAGAFVVLRNFRRPNQWYIGLFMLHPAWRGRGVGRAGIQAFESWAASQGVTSILLAAVAANVRAQKFWQGLGFTPIAHYANITLGLRVHELIEYEKAVAPIPPPPPARNHHTPSHPRSGSPSP